MVNMALFYPHYRNNTANIVIIKGIMKKGEKKLYKLLDPHRDISRHIFGNIF
jgi:hypothetical protein